MEKQSSKSVVRDFIFNNLDLGGFENLQGLQTSKVSFKGGKFKPLVINNFSSAKSRLPKINSIPFLFLRGRHRSFVRPKGYICRMAKPADLKR